MYRRDQPAAVATIKIITPCNHFDAYSAGHACSNLVEFMFMMSSLGNGSETTNHKISGTIG